MSSLSSLHGRALVQRSALALSFSDLYNGGRNTTRHAVKGAERERERAGRVSPCTPPRPQCPPHQPGWYDMVPRVCTGRVLARVMLVERVPYLVTAWITGSPSSSPTLPRPRPSALSHPHPHHHLTRTPTSFGNLGDVSKVSQHRLRDQARARGVGTVPTGPILNAPRSFCSP